MRFIKWYLTTDEAKELRRSATAMVEEDGSPQSKVRAVCKRVHRCCCRPCLRFPGCSAPVAFAYMYVVCVSHSRIIARIARIAVEQGDPDVAEVDDERHHAVDSESLH